MTEVQVDHRGDLHIETLNTMKERRSFTLNQSEALRLKELLAEALANKLGYQPMHVLASDIRNEDIVHGVGVVLDYSVFSDNTAIWFVGHQSHRPFKLEVPSQTELQINRRIE